MLQSVQLQRPFSPAGGHAFTAEIPPEVQRAIDAGSVAVLAEDDRVLGPAGSLHQHIRDGGGGAFSVWGTHVYLSSSDRSDCNTNRRTYSLVVIDTGSPTLREALARRDDLLLDLLHRNREHNNSLVANFLGYFQVMNGHLRRNGVALPRRALELGTGRVPYTAVRFLAAGVEHYVANDVQGVDRTLPALRVQQLAGFLDLIDPAGGERLRSLAEPVPGADGAAGQVRIRGLEVQDQRPFETLAGPNELDLVFSTSVLEHVHDPRAVVARMYELLRAGGHAWHCIDLRDHRDFARPLDFLTMTREQYAAIDTENRLRASDWRALFVAQGFEVIDTQYSSLRPGCERPSNASLVHSAAPPSEPWVDAALRSTFRPPFASLDLVDLSILGITLLCRKP